MEGGNFRFMAPCTVQGTSTDKVVCTHPHSFWQ
jgi:hypothetical protein